MITRENLSSFDPKGLFGSQQDTQFLSEECLNKSLITTLVNRPADQPVWVFGYGSLIWNPAICYADRREGGLKNWSRAFCMKLTAGRGSASHPGRMLGLVPGTGIQGVLFSLREEELLTELRLLWKREMCTGSYVPIWEEAQLSDGQKVIALVFVMACDHESYDAHYTPDHVADFIAKAEGPLGSNAEYIEKLNNALNGNHISDVYVQQVAEAVLLKRGINK
ncbi:hypothetical protein ASE93_24075 [Serratia sp. Leaf50]|nr:hypothetical protein ASE93_24075 [Serratia sp. Leaf50]